MRIENQTIGSYVEDVISSKPVPGGGSVSALAGSQGAALIAMVIALTVNKKYFADFAPEDQEQMKALAEYFAAKKDRLLELSGEDIAAYDGFMVALRLPKDTEEEKRARKEAMQKAQIHAMDIPLYFARLAAQALERVPLVARLGNVNAISDAAVGTLCLEVAVRGGVYNARINLPGIEDQALVNQVAVECKSLIEKTEAPVKEILQIVEERIG